MSFNNIKLNSKITRQQRDHQAFSKLKVSDDFNLFIYFSDTNSEISIEANRNLHDHIKLKYVDNTLVIEKTKNLMLRGKEVSNIYITTPSFSEFEIKSDSNVKLYSELNTEYFRVQLKGDSSFIGSVNSILGEVIVKDDSVIDLSGKIHSLKLRVSGDSKFESYDLVANDLEAELSGDSSARITANNKIELKVKGDSDFRFKGTASVNFIEKNKAEKTMAY